MRAVSRPSGGLASARNAIRQSPSTSSETFDDELELDVKVKVEVELPPGASDTTMRVTRPLRGILPRSSYYNEDYRQGAALMRARRPYLVKNIFTGLGLFAFAMSIYTYTFYAVAQDDFSDIPMPDAPASEPKTPIAGVAKQVKRLKEG